MTTRWSGGAALVPVVSRTFGKWLNVHSPGAKRLLCECLCEFKVQDAATEPTTTPSAAKGSGSAFSVRVEAAGSGKVLLPSLELELDDDVAALYRKLATALHGHLGVGQLQLFLGHGGDEILEYEDDHQLDLHGDGTPPAWGIMPAAPVPNHRPVAELGIAVSGSLPLVVSHQRYVNRTIHCHNRSNHRALRVKICQSGEFVVVAFPRSLQVFRLATGIPTASIPLEPDMLYAGCALDISARGDLVAIGSASRAMPVTVWAVGSPSSSSDITASDGAVRIHAELQGTQSGVSCVAITRDDKYVVTAKEKVLSVWNLENEGMLHTLVGHVRGVKVVQALRDGNIVSAATDSASILWSPSTGMRLRRFAAYTGEPLSVVQGHDGFMYVTMRDPKQCELSTLVVSDNPARRKCASEPLDLKIQHAIVAPDGNTLISLPGRWSLGRTNNLILQHLTPPACASVAASSAHGIELTSSGCPSDYGPMHPLQWCGGPPDFDITHFDISEDGQCLVLVDHRETGAVLEVRRLQSACEDALRAIKETP